MSERYTIFKINVFFENEILMIFETFDFEIFNLKKYEIFRILKISEMDSTLKTESTTVFSAIGIFR